MPGVSGNSRSRSFPRMEASDSRSRTLGMDFFIPFPFPNFGNVFFHSLPVPEFWEWIFSFPSRSQTLGMEIFHSLPVPELTISKSGIKRENGRLWEMLVFQHFQLPLHFILHKNGGSKVKVAYCCLVIYELNSMSVSDYHPTCGRQFLATKMKVKWKFGMDIGQHGGLPSTPPRFVKRARFFRFFPEPFPYFPNISQHFQSVLIIVIFSFHSRSRSRPFPGKIASDSHSRILGMDFFHSLPVPKIWDWIFLFPSRSQILGMGFFNSLPIPELWEWNFLFPFPFPNPQKSFPLTPATGCHHRKQHIHSNLIIINIV